MRTRTDPAAVALTLDACGGSGGGNGVDHELLTVLRRHAVPATLFLNVRWVRANGSVAAELAQDPLFELANHGHRHRPLTVRERTAYGIAGTGSVGEVVDEIEAATPWFVEHTGAPPRWFRAGTAHTDDVAATVAERLGQPIAGFSVNADFGATAPAHAVARALGAVSPGDIVIGHMNRPGRGTAKGFATALPRLLDSGARFTTLTLPAPGAGVSH
ncbi:polysaccharide deacetylase [Knoellia sinensis KCTC 19936]|uniref:Polysaccharide deacetylase n=1 Tax=Knoellia sinensis KCTC 19936 TaxID=1385520 RepID=A0A0A0J988_9MICO|nr:polysaccharide deacetylase family protein [Knoellia sinensis]KGN32582.1 polysaccharide deacetylase [Knoellia sinensis KCTC 19936]